jgi:tetratricopeptide (TPR) repeat protein
VFAGSRLSDAERDAGARRHAEHYQKALAAANALYLKGGDEIARGLTLFDRERANIESGHAWAAVNIESDESAAILCIAYPDAGAEMFHLRQRPRERIRWLEAMLTAARRLNRRDTERRALGNVGAAYHHLGDIGRAIDFYHQSLDISRETGDRLNEWRTLLNIGVAHKDLDDPRDALELYERALAFFREIGDRSNEGTALGHIGVAYEDLGESLLAIELHKQRFLIAREIGDRLGEAAAFANLGRAYYNLNYPRRAIKFYERQLAIARKIAAPREEAHGLLGKAAALYALGKRRQAIRHLQAALSINEQIEDPQAEIVREFLSQASGKSRGGLSLKELIRVSWAMFKFLRKPVRK